MVLNGHIAPFHGVGGNPVNLDPAASQLYRLLAAEQDLESPFLPFSNQKVEGIGPKIEYSGYHSVSS